MSTSSATTTTAGQHNNSSSTNNNKLLARGLPIYCEVYENQRYFPVEGWSERMLPTDRWKYSCVDGKEDRSSLVFETINCESSPAAAALAESLSVSGGGTHPPPAGFAWKGSWEPKYMEFKTDSACWAYAIDFPREYHPEMGPTDFVRRKRYLRQVVVVDDALASEHEMCEEQAEGGYFVLSHPFDETNKPPPSVHHNNDSISTSGAHTSRSLLVDQLAQKSDSEPEEDECEDEAESGTEEERAEKKKKKKGWQVKIFIEVYENQRYFPLAGWGEKMLPTDRWKYSNLDGKEDRSKLFTGDPQSTPPTLSSGRIKWAEGTWSIAGFGANIEDRWSYAIDFPAEFHDKKKITDFVRRRRWIKAFYVDSIVASTMETVQERGQKFLVNPVSELLGS